MELVITTPDAIKAIFREALDERDRQLKTVSPHASEVQYGEKMGISEVVGYLKEQGYVTTVGNLYNKAAERRIPCQKVNRKLTFSKKDIDRWLETQTVKS